MLAMSAFRYTTSWLDRRNFNPLRNQPFDLKQLPLSAFPMSSADADKGSPVSGACFSPA